MTNWLLLNLRRLKKEYTYQLDGGTKYRQLTASYALDIAKKVGDVEAFLVKENPVQLVKKYKPNLDRHRLNDVSKMLRVLAGRMHYEKAIPERLKEYRKKKEDEEVELV